MNLDAHKQALQEEEQQLRSQLSELGIENLVTPTGVDWVATPAEPATAVADENVAADRREDWIERRAEVAPLENRYNNIVKALNKIEAGTYGMCEVCQQPIEEARLNANPAARTCIAHISEEETSVQ
jgi:RNA polymerase-binding transcription factor DksA